MVEYRKIDGFERYSVGSDGTVINNQTGKVLSQRKTSAGYYRVNLRKGDRKYEKPTVRNVHRLVAMAFVANDDPVAKPTVNHIDGNKLNNCASNLEWCSSVDNLKHAWRTGLMPLDRYKEGFVPRCPRRHTVGRELARLHNKQSHSTPEYKEKTKRINHEVGNTHPVEQIDKETGEVLAVYDNCYDAARALFADWETRDRLISRCARGACKSAYGYYWRYKKEVMSP